jgi:hypothetical protein
MIRRFFRTNAWLFRSEYTAVIAIYLLCILSRIFLLSKGPFHYDVVDYMIGMRDKIITFHGASYPLCALVVLALAWLKDVMVPWASHYIVLSAATVYFSACAAVVMYIVFKRLFGEGLAVAYALLVSFMPPFFSVTTYGRIDHALVVFLVPLAIYFFWKKQRIVCSVMTALCIVSRPECIFLIFGYIAYGVIESFQDASSAFRQKAFRFVKEYVFPIAGTLILAVILACVITRGKWFSRVILRALGKEGSTDTAEFLGISLGRSAEYFIYLSKFMLITIMLAFVGVFQKIKERDWKTTAFFLVVFLCSFIFVSNFVAGDEERHYIFPLFFLFFFAGHALSRLITKPWLFVSCIAVVIVSMLYRIMPMVYGRHQHQYQVDFVRYLEGITDPRGAIIVQDERVFIEYYSKLNILVPPADCNEAQWGIFREQFYRFLNAGRPLYLVASALTYDRCLYLRNLVDERSIREIGSRMNEDWQRCLDWHVFKEQVFLVRPLHPVNE